MQPSFHLAHTKIQNHCVFNVDEYVTREAQPVSAKNRKLMFCPDYLHRVINTNDCPSVVSCSPGYVLCEDNTCRKSMSVCPVTRLCEYFTCSDGRCVKDNTQCPSNIVCGYGKKRTVPQQIGRLSPVARSVLLRSPSKGIKGLSRWRNRRNGSGMLQPCPCLR